MRGYAVREHYNADGSRNIEAEISDIPIAFGRVLEVREKYENGEATKEQLERAFAWHGTETEQVEELTLEIDLNSDEMPDEDFYVKMAESEKVL